DGIDGVALALMVGAVVLAPYGVLAGGSALLDPTVLLIGLGVAVLSSAVPYTLELVALRRLPAGSFGVLMSLEPAAASVVGLFALGQVLHPVELVAVALVCIASLGVSLGAPRLDEPAEAEVTAVGS